MSASLPAPISSVTLICLAQPRKAPFTFCSRTFDLQADRGWLSSKGSPFLPTWQSTPGWGAGTLLGVVWVGPWRACCGLTQWSWCFEALERCASLFRVWICAEFFVVKLFVFLLKSSGPCPCALFVQARGTVFCSFSLEKHFPTVWSWNLVVDRHQTVVSE